MSKNISCIIILVVNCKVRAPALKVHRSVNKSKIIAFGTIENVWTPVRNLVHSVLGGGVSSYQQMQWPADGWSGHKTLSSLYTPSSLFMMVSPLYFSDPNGFFKPTCFVCFLVCDSDLLPNVLNLFRELWTFNDIMNCFKCQELLHLGKLDTILDLGVLEDGTAKQQYRQYLLSQTC